MKSKTLQLINKYHKLLREQDDAGMQEQPTPEGGDVQDVVDPTAQEPQEEMPLTSQGEEEYISSLIDAALFKPSAEEAKVLLNYQSVMSSKRYTNAREEILPGVLAIISPQTQDADLRQSLSQIN